MVERIYKSKNKMRLHRNGVKLVIYHKAVVEGYIKYVWFANTTITNNFPLKNLIQKCRVTYNSLRQFLFFTTRKTKTPT